MMIDAASWWQGVPFGSKLLAILGLILWLLSLLFGNSVQDFFQS